MPKASDSPRCPEKLVVPLMTTWLYIGFFSIFKELSQMVISTFLLKLLHFCFGTSKMNEITYL